MMVGTYLASAQTKRLNIRQADILYVYILEDFENASLYFALFLQTVYAIEKLLAGFNVEPRIGMNQSFI